MSTCIVDLWWVKLGGEQDSLICCRFVLIFKRKIKSEELIRTGKGFLIFPMLCGEEQEVNGLAATEEKEMLPLHGSDREIIRSCLAVPLSPFPRHSLNSCLSSQPAMVARIGALP